MRVIGPSHPCFVIAKGATPTEGANAGADAVVDADPDETTDQGLLLGARVDSADVQPGARADLLILGDGEITNRPLIERCASSGLPTLLGTGGSSLKEVARAAGWFQLAFRHGEISVPARQRLTVEGGGKLILLHGSLQDQPTDADQNLRAMGRMHGQSLTPVGFDDRARNTDAAALSVACGGVVVVRRFDARFAKMVESVRCAEVILGEARKDALPDEIPQRARVRRRIVAGADLPAGRALRLEDIMFESPEPSGDEFAPHHLETVIGQELLRDIAAGKAITSSDLGGGVPEPAPWFSPRPSKTKPL